MGIKPGRDRGQQKVSSTKAWSHLHSLCVTLSGPPIHPKNAFVLIRPRSRFLCYVSTYVTVMQPLWGVCFLIVMQSTLISSARVAIWHHCEYICTCKWLPLHVQVLFLMASSLSLSSLSPWSLSIYQVLLSQNDHSPQKGCAGTPSKYKIVKWQTPSEFVEVEWWPHVVELEWAAKMAVFPYTSFMGWR